MTNTHQYPWCQVIHFPSCLCVIFMYLSGLFRWFQNHPRINKKGMSPTPSCRCAHCFKKNVVPYIKSCNFRMFFWVDNPNVITLLRKGLLSGAKKPRSSTDSFPRDSSKLPVVSAPTSPRMLDLLNTIHAEANMTPAAWRLTISRRRRRWINNFRSRTRLATIRPSSRKTNVQVLTKVTNVKPT